MSEDRYVSGITCTANRPSNTFTTYIQSHTYIYTYTSSPSPFPASTPSLRISALDSPWPPFMNEPFTLQALQYLGETCRELDPIGLSLNEETRLEELGNNGTRLFPNLVELRVGRGSTKSQEDRPLNEVHFDALWYIFRARGCNIIRTFFTNSDKTPIYIYQEGRNQLLVIVAAGWRHRECSLWQESLSERANYSGHPTDTRATTKQQPFQCRSTGRFHVRRYDNRGLSENLEHWR